MNVELDPPTAAAVLLHKEIVAFGDDIEVAHQGAQIRYLRRARLFCILKPMARRVDVGFFKLGRARSKRILIARGKLPFVPYRVEVEAPGDVDSELRAWLRESYELAAGADAP